MIFYGTGTRRIFYRSENFATGLTVTAYVWNTSLVKSALQTFIEISDGLYYLDYSFSVIGGYPIILYETAVAKTNTTIRIFPAITNAGTGSTESVYNVVDDDGNAIAGASVVVTSDIEGTVKVAEGTTDDFGNVTFYLNAGTYYMWTIKSGYSFTCPDTEVV